jgi:hypothetical protein
LAWEKFKCYFGNFLKIVFGMFSILMQLLATLDVEVADMENWLNFNYPIFQIGSLRHRKVK